MRIVSKRHNSLPEKSAQKKQSSSQRKQTSKTRKITLAKFLQSNSMTQTKNSLKSTFSYNTSTVVAGHPVPQTYTPRVTRQVQLAPQFPKYQPQQKQFLETLSQITQPIRNLERQTLLLSSQVEKLAIESTNLHKNRHQEVLIGMSDKESWRTWMGKVFEEICERAFQLYVNEQLMYDEMRAFCCQKILMNFIQFQKLHPDVFSVTSCIEWQTQAKKILQHLCHKYPQTQKIQINKKLQQVLAKNKINNFQSDDYDLIDKTKVQFKYKSNMDYTEEIMSFLNEIITITERQSLEDSMSKKNKNLFSNFHTFFTNVFSLVNHRDRNLDVQVLAEQKVNDKEYCRFRFSEEDEIQYYEKVKSYTKVQIGAKIPLNSSIYSYDEIVSGNIQIKSKPVARVVDKWTQELKEKILKPQKHVLQRIHRFKGGKSGQRVKLSKKQKQVLCSKLIQQKQSVLQFDQKIRKNIESVSQQLMNSVGNLEQLTFMNQSQAAMGQFSCKMNQASIQYSLQKLNFLIGSLLKAVQKTKTQLNKEKTFSFTGEEIDISLVTFKIGDLLRCKFISKEDEVLRIFQFLMTMSEVNYLNMFKIVRIKNRLSQSTRDILINALFKNQVVCQIQLAVNQKTINQKQYFMDKFNHFLYQLKRAQTGVLLQLCNIWVNNCPKSQTFKKYIIKDNEDKKKLRKTVCQNKVFEFVEGKYKTQRLPFICKLCKIFYPRQKTIFKGVLFDGYTEPICGQCLSSRVEKSQRISYLFAPNDKPSHIANYLERFRIPEVIEEIFSFEQIKAAEFMVMVPINSKRINKFAIRKIMEDDMIFLVQKYLTDDSKLQMKVKYQFYLQKDMKDQQKKFFQKYSLFTFNRPVQLKPVILSKQNFNGLLQKDFKKLQTYQSLTNNRLQCLHLQFGQQYFLFPHYNDPTIIDSVKLKNSINSLKIVKEIQNSNEVLQLSSKKLKEQFMLIPSGVRVKMNTIVKEMWLDDNLLENVDFVNNVYGLEVFSARNNKIKSMPQFPALLQVIDLSSNMIQKIQGFDNAQYPQLKILNIGHNYITKIQNLTNVFNLQQLYLEGNQIPKIQNLDKVKGLKKLNISSNPIERIQNLETLAQLQYLSLGKTTISVIEQLQTLQNLTTLIIQGNIWISDGKDSLALPNKIKKLNLGGNHIKSMSSFNHLVHIQQIMLHNNQITTIQSKIWLQNLRLLNLSNNQIQQIPDMKQVIQLRQLYLSNNSIKQIKGLEENMFLSILDVSFNQLTQLKNIKYLLNLTKLSASNNRIQTMEQFENLKSLSEISLANNLISKIIVLPQSLKKINLQNNQVESMDWISMLLSKRSSGQEDKVQEINLKDNKIPKVMLLLVKELLGLKDVNIIV